jgi:hypothetical protein
MEGLRKKTDGLNTQGEIPVIQSFKTIYKPIIFYQIMIRMERNAEKFSA